jgi:hypothetical protein
MKKKWEKLEALKVGGSKEKKIGKKNAFYDLKRLCFFLLVFHYCFFKCIGLTHRTSLGRADSEESS